MKRMTLRVVALGLTLLLCAGAAAESADDLSYTMSEKLFKQLDAGSGFVGTLTLTAAAAEGREKDAFSTVKPLLLDWTYIKVHGDADTPDEMRLKLSLNASEYQHGSAELSVQDGDTYLQSSLLGDGWYLVGDELSEPLLRQTGLQDALPAVPELTQTGGLMPGTAAFFQNMAVYLIGGNTGDMSGAMQQYTTGIDFWLEGYRGDAQMVGLDDGTSVMEILYVIPADEVKTQLKKMLVDLMNDEALLSGLASLMPDEQAGLYLEPSLQPYYFYAVNELPLTDDLTVRRVMSLLGDTVELSVTMPMYDSESGAVTLQYDRKKSGEDMPYDNTIRVTGQGSYAELSYRTYETQPDTDVYQGTILIEGAEADGVKPQTLRAAFDLSIQSVTTKDLNGYETLNQDLKLSVAPVAVGEAEDASQYVAFSQTDLTLDMRFASLAAKNAPTEMDLKLSLSGEGMAQEIALEISGTTASLWTPEAFDKTQATDLRKMPADELESLLSQAVIKGGLLVLPYINLPQITPDAAD